MRKREMKAVVVLNNFWEWSGGFEQFLMWEGIDKPDSFDFYTHKAANDHFKKFISDVLSRKNSINGISYSSDDTIMSWQLANEPRSRPAECQAYSDWITDIAKYIRSRAT